MTDLGLALQDYLRLRESLGYKVVQPSRSLRQFVAYLEKVGLDHVTTEATVAWATQPQGVRSGEWARRFGLARGFAGYLRTIDPATEGPPAGFVAGKNRRATPYLYSDCEVAALMAVARRLSSPMRMGRAVHPRRIGLQHHLHRAPIQARPPAPTPHPGHTKAPCGRSGHSGAKPRFVVAPAPPPAQPRQRPPGRTRCPRSPSAYRHPTAHAITSHCARRCPLLWFLTFNKPETLSDNDVRPLRSATRPRKCQKSPIASPFACYR